MADCGLKFFCLYVICLKTDKLNKKIELLSDANEMNHYVPNQVYTNISNQYLNNITKKSLKTGVYEKHRTCDS